MAVDVDSYWEYSDPAASEERFRQALGAAKGDERLEILTQVARSYSLRKRFDDAHGVLDGIRPQVEAAGPRVKARYHLERGRTFNSAGRKDEARSQFLTAFDTASAAKETGLAVDAAHMVAITYEGTEQGLAWNEKGLALARSSSDPKAQALVAAMLNNSAWDLFSMKRYDDALARFREAETAWVARGRPVQIRVAKWSVARCLRAMGRFDEALAILRPLQAQARAAGEPDLAIDSEIAANVARDRDRE